MLAKFSQIPKYARTCSVHVREIDATVQVDVEKRRLECTVKYVVRLCPQLSPLASAAVPLNELSLDAVGLVDLQLVDGQDAVSYWHYDGQRVLLRFAKSAAAHPAFTLHYTVEQPLDGVYFYAPDESYPNRPFLALTDHETERARYWLPCVDEPRARVPVIHMRLRRDAHLTALASGKLISDTLVEDTTTGSKSAEESGTVGGASQQREAHWMLEFPCATYLLCWAVGQLHEHQLPPKGELAMSLFAGSTKLLQDMCLNLSKTPQAIDFLQDKLNYAFPMPKYFQIGAPFLYGAMESVSLVTWDTGLLPDETVHQELGQFSERICVHELAHSYFGDAIVCHSFEDAWLKEAFAVQMEREWLLSVEGQDEYDYHVLCSAKSYRAEVAGSYNRPVVCRCYTHSWELFDKTLYDGGSTRLHQLRSLLGVDMYWQGVQHYVSSHMLSTATTNDLFRAFQHVTRDHAIDLAPFFNEWIYASGYPEVDVSMQVDPAVSTTVTFTMRSSSKFHLVIPVEVTFEDNTSYVTYATVSPASPSCSTTFSLSVNGRPVSYVVVDPSGDLPLVQFFYDKSTHDESSLATVARTHKRLFARISAYSRLLGNSGGSSCSPSALKLVREAIEQEQFWGVRVQVAQMLAKSASPKAHAILLDMADRETSPRAQRLVVGALIHTSFRTRETAERLRKLLGTDQLMPLARGAAWQALGKQQQSEDFDLLASAIRTESGWLGRVKQGALWGLAEMGEPRALEILLTHCGYGAEPVEEVRAAAVRATCYCARLINSDLPARVNTALRDALVDSHRHVRRAAINQAAVSGDRSLLSAVLAARETFAAQYLPSIDADIAKLKRPATSGPAGAK